MAEIAIKTERRTQLVDVTSQVARLVKEADIRNGICHLYVSHTTAGVMINEHDDPDVARDIEWAFDRMAPRDAGYRHAEGNADSHIKAALAGTAVAVFIADGKLALGRWQGIFFCEFDGPRERRLQIKIISD